MHHYKGDGLVSGRGSARGISPSPVERNARQTSNYPGQVLSGFLRW
jgi:hypothetical protein